MKTILSFLVLCLICVALYFYSQNLQLKKQLSLIEIENQKIQNNVDLTVKQYAKEKVNLENKINLLTQIKYFTLKDPQCITQEFLDKANAI
jgi:cellulose synthase/poly-beta-1,6-N-acetylglucosamine synthase-like glycosyltransferase